MTTSAEEVGMKIAELDDNFDAVAKGGGDQIRVALGTAGDNAASPLYQIDKALNKLLPEAEDPGEFGERLDDFKATPSAQLTLDEFHQNDSTLEFDPPVYIARLVAEHGAEGVELDLNNGKYGARGGDEGGMDEEKGDDESREEPVADHHHHADIVLGREVARDAVLHREDEGGQHHQPDAESRVLFRHQLRSAIVMCLLRPNPGARVTAKPAASRARRTWRAAV